MKGQTAMEYFMTYGWAILIILIVGGLLVYYGVFSIQISSPTKEEFCKSQGYNYYNYGKSDRCWYIVNNTIYQTQKFVYVNNSYYWEGKTECD